jgi:hypothetical protein
MGGKVVMLKCRVFLVVRSIAMVLFRVEPKPELTREFGPVANNIQKHLSSILQKVFCNSGFSTYGYVYIFLFHEQYYGNA